jgi:hypothetical protein
MKCVLWFSVQVLSTTFCILRRIERDVVISVHCCSCTVPVISVHCCSCTVPVISVHCCSCTVPVIPVHCCSCTVTVLRVRFYWNWNLFDRFSQNSRISNFMKICPLGAELFDADRRTWWSWLSFVAVFRTRLITFLTEMIFCVTYSFRLLSLECFKIPIVAVV